MDVLASEYVCLFIIFNFMTYEYVSRVLYHDVIFCRASVSVSDCYGIMEIDYGHTAVCDSIKLLIELHSCIYLHHTSVQTVCTCLTNGFVV